jgi:hypothetical protein
MYILWNDTDGVPAWPEPFKTERAARKAAQAFRARYLRQGYYLTADGQRIDPKVLVLVPKPTSQ